MNVTVLEFSFNQVKGKVKCQGCLDEPCHYAQEVL